MLVCQLELAMDRNSHTTRIHSLFDAARAARQEMNVRYHWAQALTDALDVSATGAWDTW